MSEQTTNRDGHDDQDQPRGHRRTQTRKLRLGIAAAVLVGGGILIGGVGSMAASAFAFGGHGHGHGQRHGGEMGTQHMMERAQHKVARVLQSVDATEEQTTEVEAIIKETLERMTTLREEKRDSRQAFLAELLGSEINRDTLEQLRQRHLAVHDQMSSLMLDALVRAAEVLTPQQREEILSKRGFRH